MKGSCSSSCDAAKLKTQRGEGDSEETGDISKMRSGDVGRPRDDAGCLDMTGRRRRGISIGLVVSLLGMAIKLACSVFYDTLYSLVAYNALWSKAHMSDSVTEDWRQNCLARKWYNAFLLRP